MKINRILIAGDPLRPDDMGGPHSQITNTRWFYAHMKTPIAEATGMVPEVLVNGAGFDFAKMWRCAGQKPSASNWAAIYKNAPEALREYWLAVFDSALVVGFEMPPGMREALDIAGIPWIDTMIHPVRFMDDIFLCFRASHPDAEAAISEAAMPERWAWRAAGAVSAFAVRKRWTGERRPFSVFAAQVGVDRSLIEDGRLLDNAALLPRIRETLGRPERLLFKDHPYERQTALASALEKQAREFRRTDRNLYGLLADPAIEELVSVSSSAGTEAKYFGVSARYVLGPSTPVRFRGDAAGEGYWSVYDDFLVPDFWRRVLAPIVPVTPEDGDRPMHRPDLLRMTLRSFWGYKEIVRDSFVDPSTPVSSRSTMRRRIGWLIRKARLESVARAIKPIIDR